MPRVTSTIHRVRATRRWSGTAVVARTTILLSERYLNAQCPDDQAKPAQATNEAIPLTMAIEAIVSAGYEIDRPLWRGKADCTQCHAGCTDSPTR
jgi:hypothetical protein